MAKNKNKSPSEAAPKKETRLESWTKTILQLAVVVLVALAARSSLADHYVIPSGSMLPTLGIKDRVFVGKAAYGLRIPFTSVTVAGGKLPERGDVVVFRSPTDGSVFIKRVVALPGDEIRVVRGRIYIDGELTEWVRDGTHTFEVMDDRRYELRLTDGGGPDYGPAEVPEGFCFVMGDNRGNSQDSRAWVFDDPEKTDHYLPLESLRGKAVAIYWRSGDGPSWDPLSIEDLEGETETETETGSESKTESETEGRHPQPESGSTQAPEPAP